MVTGSAAASVATGASVASGSAVMASVAAGVAGAHAPNTSTAINASANNRNFLFILIPPKVLRRAARRVLLRIVDYPAPGVGSGQSVSSISREGGIVQKENGAKSTMLGARACH